MIGTCSHDGELYFCFQVVKNLGVVTKGLDKAMASMNLEEVEKIMQKFESTFEDLDVRESVSFYSQSISEMRKYCFVDSDNDGILCSFSGLFEYMYHLLEQL